LVKQQLPQPNPRTESPASRSEVNSQLAVNDTQIFNHNLSGPILSAIVSIAAVIIVHRLTKRRDREKLVMDQFQRIMNQCDEVDRSAKDAWIASSGSGRDRAIAETYWRLQLLGQTIASLATISTYISYWKSGWWLPCPSKCKIDGSTSMIAFRKELTSDPFDDRHRRKSALKTVVVEQASGRFRTEMGKKLDAWLSSSRQPD
jgi:hypothetical protein